MALRTECLCDGEHIGIESIYTIIDRCQIYIPEKLEYLRKKSQNNELFCPCGCGSNLILVAGANQLREQHFRMKDKTAESKCYLYGENKISLNSKIVLKCWLDKNLKENVDCRVPICAISDSDRKYELSFLSRRHDLGLVYYFDRYDISDDKLNSIDGISHNIIYVVDKTNRNVSGQYPEQIMKIQNRQGYCLFLDVDDYTYEDAELVIAYTEKLEDGFWHEIIIGIDTLDKFLIDDKGEIFYDNHSIIDLKAIALDKFKADLKDKLERQRKAAEESEKNRAILQERQKEQRKQSFNSYQEFLNRQKEEIRIAEERKEAEKIAYQQEFIKSIESTFDEQSGKVCDKNGIQYVKCQLCGKIYSEENFSSRVNNFGQCKRCMSAGRRLTKKEYMSEGEKPVRKYYREEYGNIVRQKPGNTKINTLDDLFKILLGCWCKETAYPSCQDEWVPNDPTFGQCDVTAMLVCDMFGGSIHRVRVKGGGTHYFNKINGYYIDLTINQFDLYNIPVECEPNEEIDRRYCGKNKYAHERYELLKELITKYLKEK